jgi:hypothetical protein
VTEAIVGAAALPVQFRYRGRVPFLAARWMVDGFRGHLSRPQRKKDSLTRERFHHPQRVAGEEDAMFSCTVCW